MTKKKKITITEEYFRQYRQKLGFTNQADVKNFFGAKDIIPTIDLNYVKLLNKRLYDILDKLNKVVTDEVKIDNLSAFKKQYIDHAFKIIKESKYSSIFKICIIVPAIVTYLYLHPYWKPCSPGK